MLARRAAALIEGLGSRALFYNHGQLALDWLSAGPD